MANDLLTGMQVGAGIGNMRVQQQERMMQLRAQMAMQAVQERQLAAQADMLIQHTALYKQQLMEHQNAQVEEQAFKMAVGKTFQDNLAQSMDPETGEPDVPTAMARTHSTLAAINPKLADDWADSTARMVSAQAGLERAKASASGKEAFTPFVQQVQTPDGKSIQVLYTSANQGHVLPNASNGTMVADEIRTKDGKLVSYVAMGEKGPRFFPAKSANIPMSTKEEIKSIYAQVARLEERYDGMKDTAFSIQHPVEGVPNKEKLELGKKIDALKERARKLDNGEAAPAAATVAPTATGARVKVRDRNGKLFTVPAEQLEEAVQQGYQKVEE